MEKAYTLGLYEKAMPGHLDWKSKLEAAKKAGYDFMEISIDETDEKLQRLDMSRAERIELINLMKIVEMPIRTMCLSGHRKYPMGSRHEDVRRKSMEIMDKAITLADDLGIRIIQLAGYDVYYEKSDEETKRYFCQNLLKVADMAASAGMILGFETMETEFMNTVEKSMEYIEMASSMYLNIYPDIGNITNAARQYCTDVVEDLKRGRGHLVAMHLKESAPGVFREVPFGIGHVDFTQAIETAWKLGVRKYVAEFWYTGNAEWKKDLCRVNCMMRSILEQQQI